jgi:tetratricopeptide (TPR) repeat protein
MSLWHGLSKPDHIDASPAGSRESGYGRFRPSLNVEYTSGIRECATSGHTGTSERSRDNDIHRSNQPYLGGGAPINRRRLAPGHQRYTRHTDGTEAELQSASKSKLTIQELEPYLTAISAAFSVTSLGFILNLVKSVRDNAQDRIAVQDERLKRASEEQARTEKWADREKAALKEQLDKAKSEMDALLKSQGIDLTNLTLGKQLSASASDVRETAAALVKEMKDKLSRLANMQSNVEPKPSASWELSLAMGAMAYGSFADAATHFDSYSKADDLSWQTNFARGVAHANARGGRSSDVASLRAYNDAIALAPRTLENNRRARVFAYRGAILKRLSRLDEAEADLKVALTLADARYELTDIHYNLACVYAMRGDKRAMLGELREVRDDKQYVAAVKAHRKDYFANFASDPDLLSIISV